MDFLFFTHFRGFKFVLSNIRVLGGVFGLVCYLLCRWSEQRSPKGIVSAI